MSRRRPAKSELTIPQVAELLGVTKNTARAGADSGKLPHRRTTGGHRRFVKADVLPFKARRLGGGGSRRRPYASRDWGFRGRTVFCGPAEADGGRNSPLAGRFCSAREELRRKLHEAH